MMKNILGRNFGSLEMNTEHKQQQNVTLEIRKIIMEIFPIYW